VADPARLAPQPAGESPALRPAQKPVLPRRLAAGLDGDRFAHWNRILLDQALALPLHYRCGDCGWTRSGAAKAAGCLGAGMVAVSIGLGFERFGVRQAIEPALEEPDTDSCRTLAHVLASGTHQGQLENSGALSILSGPDRTWLLSARDCPIDGRACRAPLEDRIPGRAAFSGGIQVDSEPLADSVCALLALGGFVSASWLWQFFSRRLTARYRIDLSNKDPRQFLATELWKIHLLREHGQTIGDGCEPYQENN